MRALVVYAHPVPESFVAALRDTTVEALQRGGHEVRLLDLYASDFDPVMGPDERRRYNEPGINEAPVAEHLALIKWCEMLVFVYPTWWFGLPAMLKGWIDRVWVPHVTFVMPTKQHGPLPAMQHIRRLGIVTSCGATWLISKWVGEPGRRTIMRGLKSLCHPRCRTIYLAHYEMDSSTPESRSRYLASVRDKMARF
ncbi:NAD(P)H-dependent oxidoreductase [Kaistia dalseonensis]|uniref:NADPH-quinone reductase n=1 Tax=Kaistia dalseonensis TaxID=410840 RepID=A0ABU0HAV4_9HYPH|nr:NAD(P)H-dependent oxidoreductase [Kaistia dalseonensis]MCX5496821.1 NAD(P)H-dependent oxidoreductase [Kaistia dalseonensis]MDQ0439447.1 putative NADPH-quinone reductase [Kaistia dalseonensis]